MHLASPEVSRHCSAKCGTNGARSRMWDADERATHRTMSGAGTHASIHGMQEFSAEQWLQGALSHHQAGRLVDAEKAYRKVLETQPENVQSLNNMGVILRVDRPDEAAACFERAI